MKIMILVLVFCLCPNTVWADSSEVTELREEVGQLKGLVEGLNKTVQDQQRKIQDLERRVSGPASVSPPVATGPATPASVISSPSRGGNLSAFNPEIGVVADVVAQLSDSSADGGGNDTLSVREVELVFGHPIDPYSRLDVSAAFSDLEEAELDEAYISHWGLPADLKARIGRFRPKIGKASARHRDTLETVDEPLVVERYFGGEGLIRTGLELSSFVPAPWTTVTHEWMAGVMEGGVSEGGTLFGTTRRRPSLYAHLKNFWDISEITSGELGATYLTGSSDADAGFEVQTLGLDATLTHFVQPSNPLRWQNEVYLQDRNESPFDNRPWGAYSLLDYRFTRRFGAGGRFDYVQPIDLDPGSPRDGDIAWSGYLTFHQSEWARWRLQYRHTDFAEGGDDNSVFLQGTVAIGVHKHELQ